VDLTGFIILLMGIWAMTAPFVIIQAIRTRRWIVVGLYALPVLWFAIGFVMTM
jgi:hypothetical protein